MVHLVFLVAFDHLLILIDQILSLLLKFTYCINKIRFDQIKHLKMSILKDFNIIIHLFFQMIAEWIIKHYSQSHHSETYFDHLIIYHKWYLSTL